MALSCAHSRSKAPERHVCRRRLAAEQARNIGNEAASRFEERADELPFPFAIGAMGDGHDDGVGRLYACPCWDAGCASNAARRPGAGCASWDKRAARANGRTAYRASVTAVEADRADHRRPHQT